MVITINIGDIVTTSTTTSGTTKSARANSKAVSELRALVARRRRSSYPTDARTERQYWLRQIQAILGDNS